MAGDILGFGMLTCNISGSVSLFPLPLAFFKDQWVKIDPFVGGLFFSFYFLGL